VNHSSQTAGYAAIFGIALAARTALALIPFEYATAAQRPVWSWWFFAIFAASFAAAAALAVQAGLPSPAATLTGPRRRWILPVTVGLIVGALTMLSDTIVPAAAARGVTTMHVRGAAAVPFYLYGAILITTVFHFLPVALAARVAGLVKGRTGAVILAAAFAGVALSEDFGYFLSGPPAGVETLRHGLSVLANGTEAVFIYRYGLVAGLLQRGTTYLLWHILWPLLTAH
jgi:hypothetical protein